MSTPVSGGPRTGSGGLPLALRDRWLVWLLVASLIGAILQITFGGVVRVTESGDGCPDWPLCYGRLIPPVEKHALIEWTHRTAGVLVGLTIVAATARAWARNRDNMRAAWLTSASLVLIAIVGGIGGAVVLSALNPALRTLHLAMAELVVLLLGFAIVAAAWPGNGQTASDYRTVGKPTRRLVAWASIAAMAAILTGSYAVWRGAGVVCPSWPLCGGAIVPQSELAWIHVAHRIVSLAAAVMVVVASFRAWREHAAGDLVRWGAGAAVGLVLAQTIAGAANPWTTFDEWARVLHLCLGTLLWAVMITLTALVMRRGSRQQAGEMPATDRKPADAARPAADLS